MNNKTKFAAKKGNYNLLLGGAFVAPVIYIWILSNYMTALLPIAYFTFLPFLFLLWIYLTTTYTIKEKYIFYRSAFVGGSFPIGSIKEVYISKRPVKGKRPAMANRGFLIKYGDHDEVFIAPSQPQEFLKELRKINKSFKVVR